MDLVTQLKSNSQCLRPIEIKLTALPDNSTCDLSEEYYSSEIVIRPDTIVYLACSIAANFKDNPKQLAKLIGKEFEPISVSGRITHHFMTCDELAKPRITKSEIKNIILGGGQQLLSPERRFDAIINSPELFN